MDFSVPDRILIPVLIIFRIHRETWTFTIRVYVINTSILISDETPAPVFIFYKPLQFLKPRKNGPLWLVACFGGRYTSSTSFGSTGEETDKRY